MARIEGITITNYRALKDVTIGKTFEYQDGSPLPSMMAVIGPNGSGKSTLLDAFGFLRDCLSDGVEEACERGTRGGFERLRTKGATEPIKFELYYRQSDDERPISYSLWVGADKNARPFVAKERFRQNNSLLHQLPIKLKNMGQQSQGQFEVAVIVAVDADDDDCVELKRQLLDLYAELPTKPPRCLFRIAAEETESWFIAEPGAVKKAYPKADTAALARLGKDAVCGAWESLARAIGVDPSNCGGGEKTEWASTISPHLNLTNPESPSLSALVSGVDQTTFTARQDAGGVKRGCLKRAGNYPHS